MKEKYTESIQERQTLKIKLDEEISQLKKMCADLFSDSPASSNLKKIKIGMMDLEKEILNVLTTHNQLTAPEILRQLLRNSDIKVSDTTCRFRLQKLISREIIEKIINPLNNNKNAIYKLKLTE